ncbi:MAG: hypothetical protein ABFD81_05305 [Syntrophaceae bacterium]
MHRPRYAIGLAVIIAALLMWPNMALADIFMKQKHHTGSFQIMGQTQPAKDVIQNIWMTDNVIRNDSEQQSVIVRLDKQTVTMIDHAKKTYAEMPLNLDKAVGQMGGEKMTKEQRQAMSGMVKSMMKFTMKVTETGEKKKIGAWNCRKYIQKLDTAMGPTTTDVWATEDIKVKGDIFAKYTAAMMTMQPGLRESMAQVMQETKKIKGMTVFTNTTSSVMGATMQSTMQLLEFKEGRAPATIGTVPAGYTKQTMR